MPGGIDVEGSGAALACISWKTPDHSYTFYSGLDTLTFPFKNTQRKRKQYQ
jgi:hypothetical protein